MSRKLRNVLLGAMVVASIALPAVPAYADTCIGYYIDSNTGQRYVGVWTCDPCEPGVYHFDGRSYVVVCGDIRDN